MPSSQGTKNDLSEHKSSCLFFSLRSFVPHLDTGKPTGVAVSHCITWYQSQIILTIRCYGHLWD